METVKGVQKASITSKLKGKAANVWNDIKLTTKKVHTKLSQTTIAKKISSFTTGKGFRRTSSSISKASAPIGVFLLGKGIINGVIHKDYTSLGIIGGRLGIEAVEWGAKGAGKLLQVGSKMGSAAKLIGKAAGPIGIVADVGLSVWSLTKAVGRLQDAKDQYERNDAIADIVQESIDIAITTAVVVATIVFPPAGIVIAVAGLVANLVTQLFVGVYKTQNEIDKINSEVPLLDWERHAQFSERFMNWFGTRKDDYIDDLVKVKKLNDIFVQHNLKYLENNPHLSGIAFPARSIAYSGACKYTRNHCPLKHAGGCTKHFEPETVLERGCDHGQRCGSHKCTNWWESTGDWSYDDYRCVCSGSSSVKEGYPRANNYIDFRSQRSIYLERAVPKDVAGANFRCKPGHETYQDYQISQKHSSTGYLCKGTIALYQKNYGGSTFYFDLEDGDDTVLLDSNSNAGNTFLINNGNKVFSSGAGKDEFIIHPNCTSLRGSIDGGGGSNSLVISNEFLKGTKVIYRGLDFNAGRVTLTAKGINDIVGRAKETEEIDVPCGLKNLRLQGGSKISPDVIEVNGICDGKAKLAAVLEGNTKVRWQDREFQLVSVPGEDGEKLELDMTLSDSAFGTILISHSPGTISSLNYKNSDNQLEFNWKTTNSGYKYQIKLNSHSQKEMENVKFLFAEAGSSYSNLFFGKEGPSLIHSLSKIEGVGISERAAIDGINNAFILNSGAWNVNCGHGQNQVQLILSSGFTQGSISCQFSERNVLSFHENNAQPMELNLLNGHVGTGIKIAGIRMLKRRKSIQEIVTVGCDTELVATNGGTSQHPDIIRIPDRNCINSSASNLFIIATTIEDTTFSKREGSVQVSVMDDSDNIINFSTLSTSLSTVAYEIMLSEFILYPTNHKHSTTQTMFSLQGRRGQRLHFQISHNFKSHQLLPGPTITFRGMDGKYSGNLMSDTKGNVRNVHFLSGHSQGCKHHFGMKGLANYYKVSGNCWAVKGADSSSNYFLLEAEQLPGTSITGGENAADNTLDVEGYGKPGDKVKFEFILGWMGSSLSDGTRFRNINQFYGRRNKSDEIVLSCGSGLLTVDGRGGLNSNNPDKIIIKDPKEPKLCNNITITLPQFTKVENTATRGSYIYDIVFEPGIDALQFVPTHENNHILQYRFHPSQLLSNISYNSSKNGENTAELKMTFVFNETLSYPAISKRNGALNPQLLFVSRDELVSSEIQLDPESKQLLARWDIRSIAWPQIIGLEGVAFNKFLVNVTSNSNKVQQIIGGSLDNEYWLYSTPKSGLLIEGSEFGINSLRLSESYAQGEELLVNLADNGGSIILNSNHNTVLASLENINEFYGRPQEIEIVSIGCSTSLIYDADQIILDPENCLFFYVNIYLNEKTEVLIVQNEQNDTSILEPEGEFRFNFLSPISFTPSMNIRYENQFLLSDFIYNLPLKLEDLSQLGFWPWNNTVFYSLESDQLPIQHQMLSDLDEMDEFYRQPKLVTKDGCELRVDRVGAVTAICSGNSEEKSAIAEIAIRLGISIIWKFGGEIAFFGHNSKEQRNILTTSANSTNHLFGGGAKDTIYEILFLQKNVYIYSGFLEDEEPDETRKQTIDLTDIIVPIRWKDEKYSKYVPLVKAIETDLVISLTEFDSIHPGSIIIKNGVEQAARFQLLLNSAAMEFKPIDHISKSHRITRDLDADENFNAWIIAPKPLLIEPGVVFSVSQEDLEDGHYITMDDNEQNSSSTFTVSRDGDDLIMSDVKSFSSSGDPTLIIVLDFYEVKNSSNNSVSENLQQIITIKLPGLNFTLNNSEIVYSGDQIETESWNEVLQEVEEELLHNMLEVPRVFRIKTNTKLVVIVSVATVSVLLFAFGLCYLRRKCCWSYRWKLDSNRQLGLSVFEINEIVEAREKRELPLISVSQNSTSY